MLDTPEIFVLILINEWVSRIGLIPINERVSRIGGAYKIRCSVEMQQRNVRKAIIDEKYEYKLD